MLCDNTWAKCVLSHNTLALAILTSHASLSCETKHVKPRYSCESSLTQNSFPRDSVSVLQRVAACCSVLQGVAACCSVLQCVAVCCSMFQRVTACCSMFQRVTACCSVLQCAADYRDVHNKTWTHSLLEAADREMRFSALGTSA